MQSTPGQPDPATAGVRLERLEPFLNAAWVAAGAGLCVYAWTLGAWGPSGPDSGFFPLLAGALILACGLAMLLRPALAPARGPFWTPEPGAARRVLLLIAGVAALVLLVRWAGFVIASLVTMPLLLQLVERRRWWYALLVGVIATAVVHVVFTRMLGMLMPRGPFGF